MSAILKTVDKILPPTFSLSLPLFVVLAMPLITPLGCGDDDPVAPPATEHTGQSCNSAEACYPWLEDGALLGNPICLDRVPSGYCTHECQRDSDCCGTPGECKTNHPQVCAPFESTGTKMCFLSCDKTEVESANVLGPDESFEGDAYCSQYARYEFGCRSTGGGSQNRKVCVP